MKQKIMKVLLAGAIICGYKVLYAPDELKKEGKEGQIQWVEGVRGWDENGTYLWTGVSPLPSYNVGIGTNTPAQKLHVQGNIQFSGALMPGGSAGSTGNILRSQGPGNPPVWVPTSGVVVYQGGFNSTANVCINSTSWTTHPGVSVTLSLQAGDIVFAWANGAIMADNNCDGWSDLVWCVVDARIAVNGQDFPDGAWQRISVDNYVAYVPFAGYTLAGRFVVPSTGNYTFELQTRRSGGNGNAITAGDYTSALQSTMVLLVIRP